MLCGEIWVASADLASEGPVFFLDGYSCEISLLVECCDSSFGVGWQIMSADEVWIGHGQENRAAEYGNILLRWQLALYLTR